MLTRRRAADFHKLCKGVASMLFFDISSLFGFLSLAALSALSFCDGHYPLSLEYQDFPEKSQKSLFGSFFDAA